MELDDLKAVWQRIDKNLELQNSLELQRFREGKARTAQKRLRPLYFGHIVQILAGVLLMPIAALAWTNDLHTPHLMLSGMVMHIYAILLVAFGGRMLHLINSIDYSAPVVTIQKQLASVRRFYIRGGMTIGLVWWLLWIPFMAMLFSLVGADLYRNLGGAWMVSCTLFGVAGIVGTLLFHRWGSSPERPRLAKFMNESVTGKSLLRAQKALDEITEFEKEYTK